MKKNELLYQKTEIEIYVDPIFKLLIDFKEIIKNLSIRKDKGIKFLYLYRKIIDKILYEQEEIIQINSNLIDNNKIDNDFYLSLILTDNPNIINYSYSFELISKLNKKKKDNSNVIKKIIISKIILELIEYYKQTDNYEEEEEKKLEEIYIENESIIKNNIKFSENFNLFYSLKDIKEKKIDSIYIDIIISLIKQNKFSDYENTKQILDQLDFENIDITKTMFDELKKVFDSNEDYIQNYNIDTFDDLKNTKIINFYYLLFKYIFKNSIYIYNINFLYNNRNKIIKIIKDEKQLYTITDEKVKDIINLLTDSKYYTSVYLKKNNDNISDKEEKNKNLPSSSKTTEEKSSKDKEINIEKKENEKKEEKDEKDENLSQNEINESIKETFYDSKFLVKNDNKGKIYFYLLNDDKKGDKLSEDRKKKYNKLEDETQILEKNFKKFLEFLYGFKKQLEKDFENKYNLILILHFYQNENNKKNSNSIFNINFKYYYYPPNKNRLSSFKDENILINGLEGILQGYYFLISDINDSNYKDIPYNNDLDIFKIIKEKDDKEKELNGDTNNENKEKKSTLLDIVNSDEVSEFEILRLKNIIGTHQNNAEFILTLSNGYIISGGKGNRILNIYNQEFIKIGEISLTIHPNGTCQIKYNDKNIIKISAFSNENIDIISYNPNNKNYFIETYKINASNFLEVNSKRYIITNVNGAYILNDLTTSLINKELKILKYSYQVMMKINDKIIAFTSNKVMPNGKDRLVFYNIYSNAIEYELEGYSFSLCPNSLLLMDNYKSSNNGKTLICACKKYTGYQNNGILLINFNFYFNQDVFDLFYNTYNFEPYCFSPISLVHNYKDKKNITKKVYDTCYFLVGGFDEEKNQGVIKLYKILFEHKIYNTKIQFIQDIILENEEKKFYGFKGAVTCINQSMDKGCFLVTCSDGNVYHFSEANLNYFLFYDEQEGKKLNYEETTTYYKTIEDKINKKNIDKKQNVDKKKQFIKLLEVFKNKVTFDLNFILNY